MCNAVERPITPRKKYMRKVTEGFTFGENWFKSENQTPTLDSPPTIAIVRSREGGKEESRSMAFFRHCSPWGEGGVEALLAMAFFGNYDDYHVYHSDSEGYIRSHVLVYEVTNICI
jgi:hypothetical protein